MMTCIKHLVHDNHPNEVHAAIDAGSAKLTLSACASRFAAHCVRRTNLTLSFSAMARSLIIPLASLLAAYFAISPLQQAPEHLQSLGQYLPYATGAVALLIAILLNQARASCIALLLMAAHGLLALASASSGQDEWVFTAAFCVYGVVLPLNLMVLSIVQERGLSNGYGGLMLGLMAAQAALVGWLLHEQPNAVISPVVQPFLPFGIGGPIPHAGLLMLALSVAVLAWQFQRQPSTLNAALLAIPPTLLAAAWWHPVATVPEVLVSALAVAFALGLVLDMQRIAYRDDLTGLPGRRALNFYLAAPGRRYTIAMLDVDHFKKFNDKHGHDVGDEVLRMVASQLQRVGGGGKAFRYGGEEFTIVFRGHDMAHARPHLDVVRRRIADYSLVVRSKSRPKSSRTGQKQRGSKQNNTMTNVTISIGLASRDADHRRPEAVLKAADNALYRAKKAGRNRIMPSKG